MCKNRRGPVEGYPQDCDESTETGGESRKTFELWIGKRSTYDRCARELGWVGRFEAGVEFVGVWKRWSRSESLGSLRV